MAAKNTVEATLRTKYEDAIANGIKKTESALKSGMAAMQSGAGAMASGLGSAFESATGWLSGFADKLREEANQAQGNFGKISLAAAAVGVMVTAVFLRLAQSAATFFMDLARRSSEVLELRLAFESLTATMGESASVMERQLKSGTEGLISSANLLRNANRVLAADIPITANQYTQLVANVFKLAKASGVDAKQAIDTLTDALIRGNTRGFQSIGIQVQVKDAISAAAVAMGEQTSKLETDAKLRAFYNELAKRTSEAVARNGTDYVSLADAIERSQMTWKEYLTSFGEGIGRSGVLSEALKRLSANLDSLVLNKDGINQIALATNHFVISALNGFDVLVVSAGVLAPVWEFAWGSIKAVFWAGAAMIVSSLYVIQAALTSFVQMLAKIPGPTRAFLTDLGRDMQAATDALAAGVQSSTQNFLHSFDGLGTASPKLFAYSNQIHGLVLELEKFKGVIVEGRKGVRDHGNGAAEAAEKVKQLNEQLRTYRDMLLSLRGTNEYQAAYAQWQKDLDEISKLTLIGEAKRDELRLAAAEKYLQRLRDIGQRAAAEAAEAQRRVEEAMTPGGDVSKMPGLPQAPLPPPPPEQKLTATQEEMKRLIESFQKLNELRMDPFHQTLASAKAGVLDFAAGAGQAIAGFFADWASGQEASGKKLLAAFLGLIGQMLVKTGVMLIQVGVAEMALASTFVGKLMGASYASGARAIATGAILAAIGGALMGAASAMAQTNEAGAGASFQQATPRPTSSQTQVIQVGAAGRAQNAAEASASQPQPLEVRLRVESNDSHIVRVVENNAKSNGRLRLVMANG